ncbi:MAG: recombinase RecA [Deltaproteobacteria bacterium]|nr:recombinase RecA [Deltaproteobacteria bacterium]
MSGTTPEKDKALATAISALEKRYGSGAIMSLGDNVQQKVEAFSTGSLGLDIALGIGGLPKGRICEIYGPESSGKTTLALHVAAEVQKKGGTVVFIDAEHALDVEYARKLGVDTSKLLVSQPDCGEQALEICETLIQSGSVDFVVIDSVAALVPRAEIDGEMADQQPGMQARLMSKAMRKLTALASKSNCSILFINQIRMKIGVMFGSPETTSGGNALKFYASVRMDVRRIGSLKDQEHVTGNRVRVKVVKNKVAAPFREAEFDIIFNEGISQIGEIIDLGVDKGIVDKTGSWYSFRGERLGQGRDGAKNFLKENPPLANEIRSLVLSTCGIDPRPGVVASVEGANNGTDTSGKKGASSKEQAVDTSTRAGKKRAELNGAVAANG